MTDHREFAAECVCLNSGCLVLAMALPAWAPWLTALALVCGLVAVGYLSSAVLNRPRRPQGEVIQLPVRRTGG